MHRDWQPNPLSLAANLFDFRHQSHVNCNGCIATTIRQHKSITLKVAFFKRLNVMKHGTILVWNSCFGTHNSLCSHR